LSVGAAESKPAACRTAGYAIAALAAAEAATNPRRWEEENIVDIKTLLGEPELTRTLPAPVLSYFSRSENVFLQLLQLGVRTIQAMPVFKALVPYTDV
jgi:hypothetical protein